MLADINDYMYAWQLLVIVPLALAIVIGGGWLLHLGVKRQPDVKRPRVGKSILIVFLSVAAAAFAAFAVFFFQKKLGEAMGKDIRTAGSIVAAAMALFLGFFTAYTALGRPVGTTVKLLILPAVAALVLLVVAGVPVAYFSNAQTQAVRNGNDCRGNLSYVARGIQDAVTSYGMPKSLQELVQDKHVEAAKLKCPANPKREVGYFYLPYRFKNQEKEGRRVIVCDYKDNHKGQRNAVLLGNFAVVNFTEAEFQDLLSEPINADFKQALEKADAGK